MRGFNFDCDLFFCTDVFSGLCGVSVTQDEARKKSKSDTGDWNAPWLTVMGFSFASDARLKDL